MVHVIIDTRFVVEVAQQLFKLVHYRHKVPKVLFDRYNKLVFIICLNTVLAKLYFLIKEKFLL